MLEKCIINVFLSTRMIHFFSSTHLRHADRGVGQPVALDPCVSR